MFILALIASRNIQPLLSDSVWECETVICFMFLNSFVVMILKIKKYYFNNFEKQLLQYF
jgi:predicted RNase H-like nuclease